MERYKEVGRVTLVDGEVTKVEKTKPARKRRPTYRGRVVKMKLEHALDVSDVEGLRDEMADWQSNLEGSNMEHLPKYDDVVAAHDALDEWISEHETDISELCDTLPKELKEWEIDVHQMEQTNKRRGLSRAMRLGNALALLSGAGEFLQSALEDDSVHALHFANWTDEEREAVGEGADQLVDMAQSCDVEFPGMF